MRAVRAKPTIAGRAGAEHMAGRVVNPVVERPPAASSSALQIVGVSTARSAARISAEVQPPVTAFEGLRS